MRKKIICLTIITGLFLSVGLGVLKEATEGNKGSKHNINPNSMLTTNGPIIPQPEVSVPVVF